MARDLGLGTWQLVVNLRHLLTMFISFSERLGGLYKEYKNYWIIVISCLYSVSYLQKLCCSLSPRSRFSFPWPWQLRGEALWEESIWFDPLFHHLNYLDNKISSWKNTIGSLVTVLISFHFTQGLIVFHTWQMNRNDGDSDYAFSSGGLTGETQYLVQHSL